MLELRLVQKLIGCFMYETLFDSKNPFYIERQGKLTQGKKLEVYFMEDSDGKKNHKIFSGFIEFNENEIDKVISVVENYYEKIDTKMNFRIFDKFKEEIYRR